MDKKITLDGKTSDWYEKAIFVLKDEHVNRKDIDFIQCAESIIENYMKTCATVSQIERQLKEPKEKSYKWVDHFFTASLCVLGIAMMCLFI